MAKLIKCPACNAEISASASACPRCGHPAAKRTAKSIGQTNVGCATVILVCLGFFVYALVKGGSSSVATPETPKLSDAQCRQDLTCIGDRESATMIGPCRRAVEQRALHSVKWKDGILAPFFSRYAWADKPGGMIFLTGNQVEFQNRFGAMTPMIYACEVDPSGDRLVDVQLSEGRLSN
jgi:hypothetical protein